ncbi:MAG: DUF4055 domain-containing protein [Pyrinomonadaceae bacterium]
MSILINDESGLKYKLLPLEAADEDKPSYMCAAYMRMMPGWTLVDDVYAGTFRIRKKRRTYLPQFPLESNEAYNDRCNVAVLMNVYARTVDAMVGLVIGSGLKTTVPDAIKDHLKNIDNAGTTFEVFAREILRDAFRGHCVVLIDFPLVPEGELPQNRAELPKMKFRPYWTRFRPEDVINWRTEVVNGETIVTQITFRECVSVPSGDFGEKEETRYIRWYMTTDKEGKPVAAYKKYRETERQERVGRSNRKRTVKVFEVIAEGVTHIDRIPIFVVYGDQEGGKILESKPPLLDLAHKNVEHLQIDSDYKKGVAIAGIALPVISTQKSDDDLKTNFAWDQFLVLGENEKFEWCEANGNALPNKRVALEDIKREMGVLGLSLIAERADANITATERVLDSVQQSNQLMVIQDSLMQGLRRGLEIHYQWMNRKPTEADKIEVSLGLDWTELVRSADHMQMLFEMAKEDFLSTLTVIESAVKYGVLPSFVKPEDEVARLKKEGRVRQSRFDMKSTTTGKVGAKGTKLDTKDESGGDNESTSPSMSESGGS